MAFPRSSLQLYWRNGAHKHCLVDNVGNNLVLAHKDSFFHTIDNHTEYSLMLGNPPEICFEWLFLFHIFWRSKRKNLLLLEILYRIKIRNSIICQNLEIEKGKIFCTKKKKKSRALHLEKHSKFYYRIISFSYV